MPRKRSHIFKGIAVPTLDEQIASNKRRTAVLFGLFGLIWGVPLGLVVVALKGWPYGHDLRPLIGCVAFVSLLLAIGLWRSERGLLKITRAKQISSHLECPELFNAVQVASIAAGIPTPRMVLVQDEAPNAFAFGRTPERTVIGMTTGLIEVMDKEELLAIACHEAAHINNSDTKVMTYASAVVKSVTYLAIVVTVIMFIAGSAAGAGAQSSDGDGGRGGSDSGGGAASGGMAGAMMGIAITWVFVLLANLTKLAISRRREYIADASAVDMTRYPEAMVSALRQLQIWERKKTTAVGGDGFVSRLFAQVEQLQMIHVEHIYFSSIFSFGSLSRRLLSTHPPIDDRIAALEPYTNGQVYGPRAGQTDQSDGFEEVVI